MRRGFYRIACAAALLLAGCGGQHHQVRIAVISLTGGETYWVEFQHAIEEGAARYGYGVSFSAPQGGMDYETQAEMVRQAIDRRVDGIIIAPQHQLVLAAVLRSAHQAGIPVVAAGMTVALAPDEYAASIQLDNQAMGALAAGRVAALLHGRGEAAVIGVSPTLEVTSTRELAFERELKHQSRVETPATKYGLSDWARSRQATLDALEEAPAARPVRAVFCSDEFSTLGALGALRSLAHRPVFVGVGQESDTLGALRRGEIDALLVSSPRALGRSSIEAMHQVLEKKPYARLQVQPVRLIDKASAP